MNGKNKKVIVGMSGGVDSTMTAVLLKEQGYEVKGVFLEFWESKNSKKGFKSAKKMAEFLNIPLFKVNAKDDFKKKVVDEFIREYKNGRTPNPCIICNPRMKFDVLLKEMGKREADFIATGHYARIEKRKMKNEKLVNNHLFKAKDKSKDQSYFLYGLRPEQLDKIIFPLGKYLKSQIRELAKKKGLVVADKKESQDVCFVAENRFDDFLKKYIKDKPGEIQDNNDKVLGKHKGLHYYTIGQRKGISLGGNGPYYVVKKDIKNNLLIVSNKKDKSDLLKENFKIRNANWISKNIEFPLRAEVKVRYHSSPVHATIIEMKNEGGIFKIKLDKAQKAVTSGQSAVFYEGEKVLGGGIII